MTAGFFKGSRSWFLGLIGAVMLVGLTHGASLPFGGVGEYHGEVAWFGIAPGKEILEVLVPRGPQQVLASWGQGQGAVSMAGSDRLLTLTLAGREHIVSYHPFMCFFTPWMVDLWLAVPLLLAMGPNLLALKAFALFNMSLYAALAWAFARSWLGPRTALVAALLLAWDPYPMVLHRALPGPLRLSAMGMLALLAWERDRVGSSPRSRVLGGFLLGFGLTNSLMFGWWVLGAIVFAQLNGLLRRWGRGGILQVGGGFLLGASPIAVYNLFTFGTVAFIARNLHQTDIGVPTLALLSNVRIRIQQLGALFDFAPFLKYYAGMDLPGNPVALPIFIAACGFLVYRGWGMKIPPEKGASPSSRPGEDLLDPSRARALLLVMATLWACTPLTLSSLGPHHLALALPFPHLVLASVLVALWRAGGRGASAGRRLGRWLALAAAIAWTLAAGRFTVAWVEALARTGGTRMWSDAVVRLTEDLETQGILRPIAIQPQPFFNVLFLSGGQVRVDNPYGVDFSTGRGDLGGVYQAALANPESRFLRKVLPDLLTARDQEGNDPHFTRFQGWVAEAGGVLREVGRWEEGGGGLGFILYRVEKSGDPGGSTAPVPIRSGSP